MVFTSYRGMDSEDVYVVVEWHLQRVAYVTILYHSGERWIQGGRLLVEVSGHDGGGDGPVSHEFVIKACRKKSSRIPPVSVSCISHTHHPSHFIFCLIIQAGYDPQLHSYDRDFSSTGETTAYQGNLCSKRQDLPVLTALESSLGFFLSAFIF